VAEWEKDRILRLESETTGAMGPSSRTMFEDDMALTELDGRVWHKGDWRNPGKRKSGDDTKKSRKKRKLDLLVNWGNQ
jgi:hypothetical protein